MMDDNWHLPKNLHPLANNPNSLDTLRDADEGQPTPARPAALPNPRSIARVYTHVNTNAPQSYWDYEALVIKWGSQDHYVLHDRVGRGKYSEVFSGRNVITDTPVIIKVLKPVRSKKIRREIKILQLLNGAPNTIQLLDLVRELETRTPCLIFELVNATEHRLLYPTFADYDVREYFYQLLLALDWAHSHGIMHRDVKPHNIMYDKRTRTLRLIDWGLAEFYHPGVPYNVRVASRYYKGPELLVDFQEYDYSTDLWSVGCVLAGVIFGSETFFQGKDNNDQLVKIVQVLGTEDYEAYLKRYSITLPSVFDKLPVAVSGSYRKVFPRKPWQSFLTPANEALANPLAIDLLDKLLRYDHQERPSAAEAMAHPYFDPVRFNTANLSH